MQYVGRIAEVWRYPVKSMAGEALDEAFVGFAGLYGDRIFAFRSSAARQIFPWLTGRETPEILRFRPRFRDAKAAARPRHLDETATTGPGITALYATLDELIVDVETPEGEVLAIDDPALIARLCAPLKRQAEVALVRSERALGDCRPLSLISRQTIAQLGGEVGMDLDARRFRANLYVALDRPGGYGEDSWLGRTLRIGDGLELKAVGRDPRCKMITLDPDTGEANRKILATVVQRHEQMAGLYAVVLAEGLVRPGDPIALID